jgi:hypothetical protein
VHALQEVKDRLQQQESEIDHSKRVIRDMATIKRQYEVVLGALMQDEHMKMRIQRIILDKGLLM